MNVEEITAHIQYMNDFAAKLEEAGKESDALAEFQVLRPRVKPRFCGRLVSEMRNEHLVPVDLMQWLFRAADHMWDTPAEQKTKRVFIKANGFHGTGKRCEKSRGAKSLQVDRHFLR